MEIIETKIENMPTINIEKDGKSFFLHSKYNPKREAELFAEANYVEGNKNYIIYGIGLGYHILEIFNLLNEKEEKFNIIVYDTNKDLIDLVLSKRILNRKEISIRYLSDINILLNDIREISEEKMKLIIHVPSLKVMDDKQMELKKYFEECIVLQNSIDSNIELLKLNFDENIKRYDEIVNKMFLNFKDIPFFLVSAGPSLDKNIMELKKISEYKLGKILVVGRALNALMEKGIIPDYIIVTDPKDTIYKNQLEKWDIEIPLIGLSTVDKNVFMNYKGKKNIAFQNGYEDSEKFARNLNIETIETGGSVATAGLDILIRFGANPIVFVGQDLAYTDKKSHSNDSKFKIMEKNNYNRLEKDIYGNDIYTSKNLSVYKRWIENRIKLELNIEFIDATEGGIKIDGTKILRLKDVISSLR